MGEDEASPEPKKGGLLSKIFKHAVMHTIWMVPVMTIGMLAAMPFPATPADLIPAIPDTVWSMVTSVMAIPSVSMDMLGSIASGDWATINYEFGMGNHGGGGLEHFNHAASGGEGHAVAGHETGGCDVIAPDDPNVQEFLANTHAGGDLDGMIADGDAGGSTILQQYADQYCRNDHH